MEQITQYVKQCREQGMPDDQIRQALLSTGWNEEQIEPALSIPGSSYAQSEPAVNPYPVADPNAVLASQPAQSANPGASATAPRLNKKLIVIVLSVVAILFIFCIVVAATTNKSTKSKGTAKPVTTNQGATNTTELQNSEKTLAGKTY
jgi:hypothetical protein